MLQDLYWLVKVYVPDDDSKVTFGATVVVTDLITNSKKTYKIVGTDGINIIRGKAGNDEIVAKGGNDTVYAGSGNDFVDGGAGSDKVFGNQGNDILQASEDAFKLPTGATDHTSNDFISFSY